MDSISLIDFFIIAFLHSVSLPPHVERRELLHYYLEIAEEEAGDDEAGLYGGEGTIFYGVAGGYLHGF